MVSAALAQEMITRQHLWLGEGQIADWTLGYLLEQLLFIHAGGTILFNLIRSAKLTQNFANQVLVNTDISQIVVDTCKSVVLETAAFTKSCVAVDDDHSNAKQIETQPHLYTRHVNASSKNFVL